MWFAGLLAKLWAARNGVAVALGIAVLAVILVSFRVAMGLPPSFESRRHTVALAATSLQLDSVPSRVVDGSGDTGNNIKTLSDRASLLGALLASRPVKQDIARSLNIAPRRVVVTMFTTFAERTRLLKNGMTPPAQPSRDSIVIDVKDPKLDEGFSPIIQIHTEAQDAKLAVAAVDASVNALRAYVVGTADRDGVPPERRMVFRQLEPARYAEEARGPGLFIALAVGLVVFGGGCAAVLYAVGIMAQMRRKPGTRGSR
jgi:hypothetical protein